MYYSSPDERILFATRRNVKNLESGSVQLLNGFLGAFSAHAVCVAVMVMELHQELTYVNSRAHQVLDYAVLSTFNIHFEQIDMIVSKLKHNCRQSPKRYLHSLRCRPFAGY